MLLTLLAIASLQSPSDTRAAWLTENALDLSGTLDTAALAGVLGDARVVLLGEPTHGEGSIFEVKTRLVQALHRDLGFDVLVFESGLHGCDAAWRALREGTRPAVDCVAEGIFPIWTQSAELAPLWQYLADNANASRPLELAGYDSQITGKASERLSAELQTLLVDKKLAHADLRLVVQGAALAAEGRGVDDWKRRGAAHQRAFDEAEKAMQRAKSQPEHELWARVVASLGAELERLSTQPPETASLAAQFNPRDRIGGENLVWLAQQRYPGKKLIVWLATMHGQRDPKRIETRRSSLDYAGVEPAGLHLARALKGGAYSVAFVCAEGRGGLPWQAPWPPLAEPEPGSFEALCVAAGLRQHLVDLRGTPKNHWLRERLAARPLGNQAMDAVWPDVVDAFVFVREQRPSTRFEAPEPTETVAPFELVPEVLREVDAARDGERAGNVWAPKWNSHATAERWLKVNRPESADITDAVGKLSTALESMSEDDVRRWRLFEVLAVLESACGQHSLAVNRWSAALEAHPPVTMADPAKHSGFQHLLNRSAYHQHRTWGSIAAWPRIESTVGTDPRCRAVYIDDWRRWVQGRDRVVILEAFLRGLTKREEQFPDERAWIRSAREELERELGRPK
jgi:erythromycin esterase